MDTLITLRGYTTKPPVTCEDTASGQLAAALRQATARIAESTTNIIVIYIYIYIERERERYVSS